MNNYDVIYCVLTYKNHSDLLEFLESVKKNSISNYTYRVVVVNNYADDESLDKIRQVALNYDCDFLENENTGYGSGNNRGIKYIQDLYQYKFLIVSNPDTQINKLDFNDLTSYHDCILAPKITKLSGEDQNPMNYKYMKFSEYFLYKGFKGDKNFFVYCGLIGIKISNQINKFRYSRLDNQFKIHSCHGSFMIIGKKAVDQLYPIFDPNIFLFCEEGDLAQKCKSVGVNIVYNNKVNVQHKQDGSMKLSKLNLNQILRKSYIYYYEKWNS